MNTENETESSDGFIRKFIHGKYGIEDTSALAIVVTIIYYVAALVLTGRILINMTNQDLALGILVGIYFIGLPATIIFFSVSILRTNSSYRAKALAIVVLFILAILGYGFSMFAMI